MLNKVKIILNVNICNVREHAHISVQNVLTLAGLIVVPPGEPGLAGVSPLSPVSTTRLDGPS